MVHIQFARALLHTLHVPDHYEKQQPTTANTLSLRVASIFVILFAGLAGGIPPIYLKVFRDVDSIYATLIRSFAAGVIAALALVHIIPESNMSAVSPRYPLGGVCVLAGLVTMLLLEHLAHITQSDAPGSGKGSDSGSGNTRRAIGPAASKTRCADSCGDGDVEAPQVPTPKAPTTTMTTSAAAPVAAEAKTPTAAASAPAAGVLVPGVPPGLLACGEPLLPEGQGSPGSATPARPRALSEGSLSSRALLCPSEPAPHPQPPPQPSAAQLHMQQLQVQQLQGVSVPEHCHVCVSHGPASAWVAAAAQDEASSSGTRQRLVAYLVELGCIVHSVVIGLSLGVNQTSTTEVRSLLIAIGFHQLLEGIGLSSVVARAGFPVLKGVVMIITYSLTCPAGVAIGIAVARSYDPRSPRTQGVQGGLNGVSGGMLLYIALVQLVAEDMGRLLPGRQGASRRLGSFAALSAGAASMCVLAMWA